MKCNMCKEANMLHEYVLYDKNTNSILIARTDDYIEAVNVSVSSGTSHHEGRRIVHLYNCEECPNSQVEYYQPEDAIAYELAMNCKNMTHV